MKRPPFLRGKRVFLLAIPVLVLSTVGTIVLKRRNAMSEIGEVKRGPIIEAVYGLGTVTAERSFQLKLGVSSTVRKAMVREGDFVKEGAPLIELDANGTFRAPFDGTITAIPFQEGETVFPGIPIITLVDLNRRYLVVSLEQQGALKVKKGQTVGVSFDSMRDHHYTGRVRAIFSNERQFWAHLDVEKLPPEILPGMTADVAIEIRRIDDVMLVPVAAISKGTLLRSRGTRRDRVEVKTGVNDGEFTEIVSGDLQPGDRVWVPTPPPAE